MSDTPRTDAAISIMHHVAGADIGVCRQLERELNEAQMESLKQHTTIELLKARLASFELLIKHLRKT